MLFEPAARILSVTELTQQIKARLESEFVEIWVEGELSNLRLPSSGHAYFTLKDATSQLRAVMFRSANRLLKFSPKDGMQVVCRGRISVYEARGEYQVVVEVLEPKGLGALQLAFEQLKERLAAEGLFDPARKRPLPALPRCIGIVTSPTGAAIRDMLNVLRRRFANVHIIINPVPVQGEGAAAAIAGALDEFNRMGGVDVLIVGRGGGSLEDLWAFNEEAVARAIHRSAIPVISAVGHEIDFTIADFVADLRAPTPSAAAELVLRSKDELRERIAARAGMLEQCIRRRLERAQGALRQQASALRDPRRLVEGYQQRLDELQDRMARGAFNTIRHHRMRLAQMREGLRHRNPIERLRQMGERLAVARLHLVQQLHHDLKQRRSQFESLVGRINGLSPLAILARGYSITRTLPQLRVIRSAKSVAVGAAVQVRLHQGALICEVKAIEDALL